MSTFLFRAFHGGYTGGVCVVQANSRDEAIEHVVTKFRKHLEVQRVWEKVRERIRKAYYDVFPEKDYRTGVTPIAKQAERFEKPTEEWQYMWNRLFPFPKEDPWIGGRVIYEKLMETLPDPENHISFGTWTEGGRIRANNDSEDEDDEIAHQQHQHQIDENFVNEVRKELEGCTLKNGRCVKLDSGFVVLQGGGT